MDPLISNGIEPVMLRALEKRGGDDAPPRRNKRRPPVRERADDENELELGVDIPEHTFDDLA